MTFEAHSRLHFQQARISVIGSNSGGALQARFPVSAPVCRVAETPEPDAESILNVKSAVYERKRLTPPIFTAFVTPS
jgi:hypothetical protein